MAHSCLWNPRVINLVVRLIAALSLTLRLIFTIVKNEWKDRFQLNVEDYLHGVITLVNELVSRVSHIQGLHSPRPLVATSSQLSDSRRLRSAHQDILLREGHLRGLYYGEQSHGVVRSKRI